MKSSILAIILAAGLSGPGLAQQGAASDADHNAHHPQSEQEQTTPPTVAPQPPASSTSMPQAQMPGTQREMTDQSSQRSGGMMSGMGKSMMMGGRMANMPAGGSTEGSPMGKPRGDQSVPSIALNAINERMHREMMMDYTGNVDLDFVRGMVAHHQGAIDMAKIVSAFGRDPQIRELAQNVIKAQESEITMMKTWLIENAK